jgi:hypothetical protein
VPRQPHDVADAVYAFRSDVNQYLGRYDRRIKQLGEDYIREKHGEVVARGGAWDFAAVKDEAFQYAIGAISGARSIEEVHGESAHAA